MYTIGTDNRAAVWTYRTAPTAAASEAEARTLLLAEAYRMVPEATATAAILSIRRTPSGRYSAMVKRVRL